MRVFYECDQCTYREWRDEGDEPYLCPVCGYYRWSVVTTEADEPSEPGDRASGGEDAGGG